MTRGGVQLSLHQQPLGLSSSDHSKSNADPLERLLLKQAPKRERHSEDLGSLPLHRMGSDSGQQSLDEVSVGVVAVDPHMRARGTLVL